MDSSISQLIFLYYFLSTTYSNPEQGFKSCYSGIIEVTINSNEKAKIALKLMMCVGGHHYLM